MCRKLLQPKLFHLLPLPQAFQATIKHKGEEKLAVALESEPLTPPYHLSQTS
jgi:hypothetical protein